MLKQLCITFLLVMGLAFYNVNAQSKKSPCDTPKHNQFNFWIGDWNVYDANNKLIGTNKIVKMQDNCVIQENWESKTSNSKGTSYNYYDSKNDSWHQIWIDNSGSNLVLKGKLVGHEMILKSKVQKGNSGYFYNQITWTPNQDGSVTQLWEVFDAKGKRIQVAFNGTYKRKTR